MKRLALGTVLFLVSFSTPTLGAANLVYLTHEVRQSLAVIDSGHPDNKGVAATNLSFDQAGLNGDSRGHAAPQQFLQGRANHGSMTQPLTGLFADRLPAWSRARSAVGPAAPDVPGLAVWLLMVAGFALSGIALRNRRYTNFESRHRQIARVRTDVNLATSPADRSDI